MEMNEAMVNEEVMETADRIMETGSGNTLKVVAGIGAAIIIERVVVKYVAKPAAKKLKEKITEYREKKAGKEEIEEFDFDQEEGTVVELKTAEK